MPAKPTPSPTAAPRLAVLLSGGGTTLLNLHDRINAGSLHAQIACVVTSNNTCKGIERAKAIGLPVHVLARKQYPDKHAFSDAVFKACRDAQADLICLAGFLSLLVIPDDYEGRVLNIHPALLPKFGGQGMYGHHVHEAVLAANETTTGCTVHYSDNTYDTGPIILQKSCPVLPNDTADTLCQRVFELECDAYPQAITKVWQQLQNPPQS